MARLIQNAGRLAMPQRDTFDALPDPGERVMGVPGTRSMTSAATSMARYVRILCAVALLCMGLAHKPPVPFDARSSLPVGELAHYVLPDGTFPVLCLPGDDGKTRHQDKAFGTGCDVCRLSASMMLPCPGDGTGEPIVRQVDAHIPVRVEAHYRQLFPPNARPRGPPSRLQA